MIYSTILTLYLVLFAVLLEKNGFRWPWFLALAGGFVFAALLSIPLSSLVQTPADEGESGNVKLLTTGMYIFFCPIHAFITVRVIRAIPKDSDFFSRHLVKFLVYAAAAMLTSFLFMVLLFILFCLYHAVTA